MELEFTTDQDELRDSLRDDVHEVEVPAEIADRARLPIERMVAIS